MGITLEDVLKSFDKFTEDMTYFLVCINSGQETKDKVKEELAELRENIISEFEE